MAHEAAHHTHVELADVVIGPGTAITSLMLDDIKSITFQSGGVVAIDLGERVIDIDYHNIDDITVTLGADAVTFTINGNA